MKPVGKSVVRDEIFSVLLATDFEFGLQHTPYPITIKSREYMCLNVNCDANIFHIILVHKERELKVYEVYDVRSAS